MKSLEVLNQIAEKSEREQIIDRALKIRDEINYYLNSGDIPSEIYIGQCKEIIALLRDTEPQEEMSDRSARFSKSVKNRLLKKSQGCVVCGGGVKGGGRHAPIMEVHHIIPREYGGDESVENGLSLCRSCHVEVHS